MTKGISGSKGVAGAEPTELTDEERLLRARFGKRARDVRGVEARIQSAAARIFEFAGRDATTAGYAATLLEIAADELARREIPGDLPAPERDVWASVGAPRGGTDELAEVRARASARFADLVSGSIVGDANVARELNVDPSRISQRLAERSLYAFVSPAGRCFPRWQLANGKPLPGLKDVLSRIRGDIHPLVIDHWFTTPNVDLEIEGKAASPAEWLATGGAVEPVVELADL